MKMNKRIAAAALVAAMSISSVTALAASTYDEYMVKAEELYVQGMYYEAKDAITEAYKLGGNTAQYQRLLPAIELRIAAMTKPAAKTLPVAFADVQKLMNQGLGYEAKSLLNEINATYSNEINNSTEFASKFALLNAKVDEMIANWEYDVKANKIWQKFYDHDFKGAYADVNSIGACPEARKAAYDKLYNAVVWKYNNLVTSNAEAIAAVKEVVANDPDFGFEPSPKVDENGRLMYYTVTVYSKNAYQKGWASVLSVYKVEKNGATSLVK